VEKLGLSYLFGGDWGCVPFTLVGFLDGLGSPFIFVGGGFCAGDEMYLFSEMLIVVIGVLSMNWFLWWRCGYWLC
jgi:hypothetical protein